MSICDKIKKYRELRGLTVDQLAKKIGKKKTSIYEWEAGTYKPGQESLILLAQALDLSVNDLLEETNFPEENMEKTSITEKKTEASLEDVLKHLIEGKADYVLINKELILEKYRLVSVEEIEGDKLEADRKHEVLLLKHEALLKDIEDRKNQIHGLYKIISELTSKLPEPVKPA